VSDFQTFSIHKNDSLKLFAFPEPEVIFEHPWRCDSILGCAFYGVKNDFVDASHVAGHSTSSRFLNGAVGRRHFKKQPAGLLSPARSCEKHPCEEQVRKPGRAPCINNKSGFTCQFGCGGRARKREYRRRTLSRPTGVRRIGKLFTSFFGGANFCL